MYKVTRYYNDKPPKTTSHQTLRGAKCAFTRHRNNSSAWYSEALGEYDTIVKMREVEESN